MVPERVVYLNGDILPQSQAKISIRDLGFLHGDAAYDTTRTFAGKIFKLNEHLDRFYNSLKYMRLDSGLTKRQMADITTQVLEANLSLLDENDEYRVIQRVTRGVSGPKGTTPTVIVECTPLPFAARARYYRDGLQVVTPAVRRTPPEAISPRAKVQNQINLVQADLEVKAQNPDAWAILLDMNGNIAEGAGSNFFIVKNGMVVTSREQFVLGGISRQTVIELAQELNIDAQEADIDLFDAYTADEAFLTSTSFCICPVSSVNGSVIGAGDIPGEVTGRLLKAYSGLVGLDIAGQFLARLP